MKPILNFPGYFINKEGEVYSTKRRGRFKVKHDNHPPRKMKPFERGGYPCVKLFQNGKKRQFLVHWLVLEAYVGPRPEGMWGLHKNDISTDNRLVNLEWGFPKKNAKDHWGNFKDYKAFFAFVIQHHPEIVEQYKESLATDSLY